MATVPARLASPEGHACLGVTRPSWLPGSGKGAGAVWQQGPGQGQFPRPNLALPRRSVAASSGQQSRAGADECPWPVRSLPSPTFIFTLAPLASTGGFGKPRDKPALTRLSAGFAHSGGCALWMIYTTHFLGAKETTVGRPLLGVLAMAGPRTDSLVAPCNSSDPSPGTVWTAQRCPNLRPLGEKRPPHGMAKQHAWLVSAASAGQMRTVSKQAGCDILCPVGGRGIAAHPAFSPRSELNQLPGYYHCATTNCKRTTVICVHVSMRVDCVGSCVGTMRGCNPPLSRSVGAMAKAIDAGVFVSVGTNVGRQDVHCPWLSQGDPLLLADGTLRATGAFPRLYIGMTTSPGPKLPSHTCAARKAQRSAEIAAGAA